MVVLLHRAPAMQMPSAVVGLQPAQDISIYSMDHGNGQLRSSSRTEQLVRVVGSLPSTLRSFGAELHLVIKLPSCRRNLKESE